MIDDGERLTQWRNGFFRYLQNSGHAKQVIDAEGHVLATGFIDGHAHMDAQQPYPL
jgi:adenine deaminase